ncbi:MULTISPECIES: hypothetical protein [unclassified Corynebacterium]|nr:MULTISPECIES: hypothetical protein [unclassified Corynebacterium]MDK8452317.1 hypothetical protein [Corynebacterium sp. MSK084]MDK8466822.1 hypothetical protein [Corynebacterium sp. MSK130]MDK8476079.1 hypothetical protein [Corynebacterium sp. MSK310]MDK8490948.1 hypothetical protein [Corynebacterium sp. MSK175]MDK8514376.1 hypothetical protein [Corynebacterium sp. MSK123]
MSLHQQRDSAMAAAVAFAALATAGLSAPGAEPSEETRFWVEQAGDID